MDLPDLPEMRRLRFEAHMKLAGFYSDKFEQRTLLRRALEYADDRDSDRSYSTAMCVLTLEIYYRYFTPLLRVE